jgi:hypothetical protein
MSEKIPQGNQGAVPEEGGIWDSEKAEAVGKATYTWLNESGPSPYNKSETEEYYSRLLADPSEWDENGDKENFINEYINAQHTSSYRMDFNRLAHRWSDEEEALRSKILDLRKILRNTNFINGKVSDDYQMKEYRGVTKEAIEAELQELYKQRVVYARKVLEEFLEREKRRRDERIWDFEAPLEELYNMNQEYFARIGTHEFITLAEKYSKLKRWIEYFRRKRLAPIQESITLFEESLVKGKALYDIRRDEVCDAEGVFYDTLKTFYEEHIRIPDYFVQHPEFFEKMGIRQPKLKEGEVWDASRMFKSVRSIVNDKSYRPRLSDQYFELSQRQVYELLVERLKFLEKELLELDTQNQKDLDDFLQKLVITASESK